MSRHSATILIIGLLAIAIAAGIALRPRAATAPASAPAPVAASPTPASEVAATPQATRRSSAWRALLADPRVQNWQAQQAFKLRVQDFFRDADQLPPGKRAVEARALRAAIEDEARAGRLAAAEALLLQVALIDATTSDPEQRLELAAQTIEQAQLASQQRQGEWRARPTPQFDVYRRLEAQIVREAMALPVIPGRLSRNEYLRRQLQQAREALYVRRE